MIKLKERLSAQYALAITLFALSSNTIAQECASRSWIDNLRFFSDRPCPRIIVPGSLQQSIGQSYFSDRLSDQSFRDQIGRTNNENRLRGLTASSDALTKSNELTPGSLESNNNPTSNSLNTLPGFVTTK